MDTLSVIQPVLFLPELAMIAMTLILFFMALGRPSTGAVQGAGLALAAMVVAVSVYALPQKGMLFFDAYQVDAYSQVFKVLISFGLFLAIFMGAGFSGIHPNRRAEYLMFLSFSALGLFFLSSSVELLTILLSLEIASYSLYVIIPFRCLDGYRGQMEAGIKYTLFGAATTGITLFGISYIFGSTHTTYIGPLMERIPGLISTHPMVLIGIFMLMSGFFFKLALFPFHFWTPDIYEGASNETAGFIATVPKIGAVALLIRFISLAGASSADMTLLLMFVAGLSMLAGNIAALVQTDVKRLLAYSSIAHAGYIMVGILSADALGYTAAIYYVTGYLIMNIAAFFVVYYVSTGGQNVSMEDLSGLYARSPMLAFTLAVSALAMAGIPPTLGFTGKFLLFTAAVKQGHVWLVVFAMVNAGIAAFYYLKLIRAAYATAENPGARLKLPMQATVMGYFLVAAIILVGIWPQPLVDMARDAVLMIR